MNDKVYYYYFVGHFGVSCGLKWRIWRVTMYFRPLRLTKDSKRGYGQSYDVSSQSKSRNQCKVRAVFLHHLCKKKKKLKSRLKTKRTTIETICKFTISLARGRRSTEVREASDVHNPVVAPWQAAKCM